MEVKPENASPFFRIDDSRILTTLSVMIPCIQGETSNALNPASATRLHSLLGSNCNPEKCNPQANSKEARPFTLTSGTGLRTARPDNRSTNYSRITRVIVKQDSASLSLPLSWFHTSRENEQNIHKIFDTRYCRRTQS